MPPTAHSVTRPLVFGEVLFDHFPDGSRVLGGAPFNVAWHLAGFGLNPLFVSRVGHDQEGDEIIRAMDQWDMDPAGLQRDTRHPTGSVRVSLINNQPEYDIVADQAYDHIEPPATPDRRELGLLYHGSLAMRGNDSAASLEKLRAILQLPVFMDINLRSPWWSFGPVTDSMGYAHWVKLNTDELREIHGVQGDPVTAAGLLRERYGLVWVILTQGEQGAWIVTADGVSHASSQPAEVIDTVGAGDAFSAVVMAGLLYGWSLDVTLGRAVRFAAAVCGIRGATTADRSFYLRTMNSWR